MANGIIGKKLGMTRLFIEEGAAVAVTVVQAGPCTVVQKKTQENDGYEALQLGFGHKKKVNKPEAGHLKKAGDFMHAVLKEFRTSEIGNVEVGAQLGPEMFSVGEKVDVSGVSKGRGFAGVIKRHGFGGGRATHGCTTHRSPGSIGSCADPSRTFPGHRMAGHMGARKNTVRNIEVIDVRAEYGVVILKGAVPGPNGGTVVINKTKAAEKNANR